VLFDPHLRIKSRRLALAAVRDRITEPYDSFTPSSFATHSVWVSNWGVELSESDEATAVRVAVAHLDARFPSLDRAEIESVVRPRVRDRFEHSRIKSFIGILAERDARTELERITPGPGLLHVYRGHVRHRKGVGRSGRPS
jgi:hypothetical protein